MIIRLKEPIINHKVSVYVNLNKKGLFSIIDREPKSISNTSGKVIAYATSLQLSNATFKVSISNYNRIITHGTRNVCAVILGTLIAIDIDQPDNTHIPVTFKPFERNDFYIETTGETVINAKFVHLQNKRAYI